MRARGFGPFSESCTMDRAMREVTRDDNKIITFINGEKDTTKKNELMSLYHSIKMFIDRWDGSNAIVRSDRAYARHAVHVWNMVVNQPNGRKILIVTVGGVISGPDNVYYAYWGTVRGVSTAQLAGLQEFIEKMTIQASEPELPIDDLTLSTDGEGNDAVTLSTDGEGNEAITPSTNGDDDDDDDDDIDSRPNAGGKKENTDDGPDGPEGNNSIDDGEKSGDRNQTLTRADLTMEQLVERIVTKANDIFRANGTEVITMEPMAFMRSIRPPTPATPIVPMQPVSNDSGLAPPTADSPISSQSLPKPNVHIGVLDEGEDGFSDESSNWFEVEAEKIIKQSTPVPSKGKITIDISQKGYTVYSDTWATKAFFNNFGYLTRFLYDIVNGPTRTHWWSRNGPLKRKNYRGFAMGPNFPNFDFENFPEMIYPEPKARINHCYYCIPRYRPMTTFYNELSGPNRHTRRLGEIGRQNAIDGTPEQVTPRPNPRNLRLDNRQGSRGEQTAKRPSFQWQKYSDADLEYSPASEFPKDLETQVLEIQKRLHTMESKYKN